MLSLCRHTEVDDLVLFGSCFVRNIIPLFVQAGPRQRSREPVVGLIWRGTRGRTVKHGREHAAHRKKRYLRGFVRMCMHARLEYLSSHFFGESRLLLLFFGFPVEFFPTNFGDTFFLVLWEGGGGEG